MRLVLLVYALHLVLHQLLPTLALSKIQSPSGEGLVL